MKKFIVAVLFFALAFPMTSLAADYSYYLPYFKETNNMGTGIALRNCSTTSTAYITVNAYTGGGTKLGFAPSAVIPTSLPPRGQKAFLVDTTLTNPSGWIQVDSTQPLVGLSFVSEDNYIMDLTMFSELYKLLYVPHSAQNNSWDTTVHVCNPQGTSTTVTVTFVNANGSVVGSWDCVLPPKGSRSIPLGDLLTGNYSNGSVEISATQGIAAFAQYDNLKTANGKSYAGISALQPPDDGGTVTPPPANPYDGSWSGTATSTTSYSYYGDPCPTAALNFSISKSHISGTAKDNHGYTYTMTGTVDGNGNVNFGFYEINETIGSGTGKASGTSASGTWEEAYGCKGKWSAAKK